ncbi:MAG TPA: helix-turn-helix domain-containing protein [Vicinamibacterales bacterium]|nr:helix-turn-helix domain-containing protein [Vicinamibacterales bacterium]
MTREQAAANRERVVDAASMLFRRHGFDGVGVADIMKAAGLTHGGFYGQFDSKEDLAAEACAHARRDSWQAWKDVPRAERLPGIVRSYLTPRHRDNREAGCLFAALGSDVVRQPRPVRRAFTERVRGKLDMLRDAVRGRSEQARRDKAIATLSGLVGALILSRAVDDAALSDEILEAAARTYEQF